MSGSVTSFIPAEFMAVLCAREVRSTDIYGVGIQSLIAATGATLAKLSLQPHAKLISRGIPGAELVLGPREPHQLAMNGRLKLFFLTPAQIDAHANVNFERVRHNDGSWQELSGAFAVPVYYSTIERIVLLVPDHSPKVFRPNLDRITASGSPVAGEHRIGGLYRVLTNKAVLQWDKEQKRLEIIGYHPGESVQSIQAATGFEMAVSSQIHETQPISKTERDALDQLVYPALKNMALPWRK